MALAHLVLGLLGRGPAHGYGLRRDLDASFGRLRPVAPGRLYGTLGVLRAAGLVAARREVVRRRARRVHAITAAGRAELRAWLERRAACAAFLHRPLLVEVAVRARLGAAAPPRLLRAQRAARERLLAELRAAGGRAPLERLCSERIARHLEVELWLLARLAAPDAESVKPRPAGSASR